MSKLRDKIKTGAWLLGSACVDALIAGGTAAVVPITMINPVIGCMIVTGSAVAAGALGDIVIKPWVDEMVDNAADELTEESKRRQLKRVAGITPAFPFCLIFLKNRERRNICGHSKLGQY